MAKNREAFNFYRSYFSVYMELNNEEKVLFMDALLNKQFKGVEPELNGIVKFAYLSQKHSINKQVEGWESKTKTVLSEVNLTPNEDPTEGGCKGGSQGPCLQEKEKEKGKVELTIAPTKVEAVELIDFEKLLSFINFSFGRKFQVINNKVRASYNARIKEGYTKDQITDAINNCKEIAYHKEKNYQYCTPEFFSRSEILDKYSNVTKQEKKVYAFHPVIFD
jgi:hypothetical protein